MITRSLEPPRRMVWPRGGKRVDEMAYDNQKGANTGGHEGRNNSEVLWRSSPLTARIIFGAVLMLVNFVCVPLLGLKEMCLRFQPIRASTLMQNR
jgi:hypothetical protein